METNSFSICSIGGFVNLPEDIEQFHRKFDLSPNEKPGPLNFELQDFRTNFLKEELREYEIAIVSCDCEKAFDALIDLVYVALGTAYLHGFPFAEGWARVHEANMKKIRAVREVDSLRGTTFDVVKPDGWTAPDLSDLV